MLLKSSLVLTLSLLACGEEEPNPVDSDPGAGEGCELQTFYFDADGDGFGGQSALESCEAPSGFVDNSEDCNDLDPLALPGGSEVCDGLDNDCDGTIDNEASDALSLYVDGDGDGFGGEATTACELGEGLAEADGDCDDADATSFPSAEELCDGLDNDCDGAIDGHAVPGDFATVQEAVDAAEDGELVCVDSGTFYEVVEISGKDIRLEGAGAGETVLWGNSSGTLLIEYADGTTVAGLSVTQSDSTTGALYVEGTRDLLIEDVEISDNACTYYSCKGVALNAWLSEMTLRDVDIVDNSSSYTSGSYYYNNHLGVVYLQGSNVVWEGGRLSDNSVASGSSTVHGSSAYSYAYGGLYINASDFHARDLEISGNQVSAEARSSSSYANTQIYGPLFATSSEVVLERVDVVDNISESFSDSASHEYAYDWGVVVTSGSYLDWSEGELSGNRQSLEAGYRTQAFTAMAGNSTGLWTDVTVTDNTQEHTALFEYCAGVYATQSLLDWTRVAMLGEELSCGEVYGLLYSSYGAAWLDNVVVAGADLEGTNVGAPVLNVYGDMVLSNSVIHGNSTTAELAYSGAVAAAMTNGTGHIELHNTAITDNSLSVDGTESWSAGASTLNLLYGATYEASYSNFHGNSGNGSGDFWDSTADAELSDVVGSEGNLDVDPGYSSTSGSAASWDLSLASGSAMIDAGDPGIEDPDGSVSDIGAYGGPGSW